MVRRPSPSPMSRVAERSGPLVARATRPVSRDRRPTLRRLSLVGRAGLGVQPHRHHAGPGRHTRRRLHAHVASPADRDGIQGPGGRASPRGGGDARGHGLGPRSRRRDRPAAAPPEARVPGRGYARRRPAHRRRARSVAGRPSRHVPPGSPAHVPAGVPEPRRRKGALEATRASSARSCLGRGRTPRSIRWGIRHARGRDATRDTERRRPRLRRGFRRRAPSRSSRAAGPVRSARGYGLHIVLVREREDGRLPTLAEVTAGRARVHGRPAPSADRRDVRAIAGPLPGGDREASRDPGASGVPEAPEPPDVAPSPRGTPR